MNVLRIFRSWNSFFLAIINYSHCCFICLRSMKHPTVPREPKFHIPQHKKIKCCLSWDDISSYAYQLWSTRKKKPEIIIMLLSPITEWSFFLGGGDLSLMFFTEWSNQFSCKLLLSLGGIWSNHQSASWKKYRKVGKSNKIKTL